MAITAKIEHLGITVPKAYFAVNEVNGGRMAGEWRGTFWAFADESIAKSPNNRKSFLAVDAVVPYKDENGVVCAEPIAALFEALKTVITERHNATEIKDC